MHEGDGGFCRRPLLAPVAVATGCRAGYCVPTLDEGASFPTLPRMMLLPVEMIWPDVICRPAPVLPVMVLP